MGKWGEYTPEEMACFKAARMYAYLADTSYSKKKAKKSVQRHSTLMKEDEEYKARHKQRMANYYKTYKRKSRSTLTDAQREERAKKRAEKFLQEQERVRQREQEKIRKQELKAAMAARIAAAAAAAAAATVTQIQEQTLPLYPDVSYTISFD